MYLDFERRLKEAKSCLDYSREAKVQEVISSIELDMEYLAVTGVEDKL